MQRCLLLLILLVLVLLLFQRHLLLLSLILNLRVYYFCNSFMHFFNLQSTIASSQLLLLLSLFLWTLFNIAPPISCNDPSCRRCRCCCRGDDLRCLEYLRRRTVSDLRLYVTAARNCYRLLLLFLLLLQLPLWCIYLSFDYYLSTLDDHLATDSLLWWRW